MNTRRPALIFDFGNVIAFFDYTRGIEALARRIGLTTPQFLTRVAGSGLADLVKRYETGAISTDEFSRSARAMIGADLEHDEFTALWADIFLLNEPVATLARELRARGYTLLVGSNTNELHARQFRRQFAETLAHFDRQILSFEVGHCKPAAAFYEACARAAQADPGDCLFIDDSPANVAGAEAAGLVAVHFRDVPTLISDLRRLGVDVDGLQL
jgi:HAD superfamily hydrolase (TIGR01509 family)